MERSWTVLLLFFGTVEACEGCVSVCTCVFMCMLQTFLTIIVVLKDKYSWTNLLFVIYSAHLEYQEIFRDLAFLTELNPYEIPVYKND